MSVVVKIGGHALDDLDGLSGALGGLSEDLAGMIERGETVALVHGGGPQIAELLEATGRESVFLDGLRVTDEGTMTCVLMALARVNAALVAALGAHGVAAVGLTGADAGLLTSRALGDAWGRAGEAPRVQAGVVRALWSAGYLPVISPVALDEVGQLLNCNADTSAGALAAALGADLVLLSDVDQLRADPDDPSSALTRASAEAVEEMIASGAVREGMRPKMRAALDALDGGATRVVLANGRAPHALASVVAGVGGFTEVYR